MSIEGKVADIINRRELVINRGADAGVYAGMKFKVMDRNIAIIDPDSSETLGTMERVKIRVKVSEVHPKFSVARTYETYQVVEPSISGIVNPRPVTRVRTLEVKGEEMHAPDQAVASVNVGDVVVESDDII